MRGRLAVALALAAILLAAATGAAVLAEDRVSAAIGVLEGPLTEPGAPPTLKRLSERYLDLEGRAQHPESQELFRRVRIEQLYRTASNYSTRQALLGERANDQEDIDLKNRLWLRITEIDTDNRLWLKATLARIGWFRISIYGPSASHAAWLLVQHADRDPAWQKEMLEILKPLAAQGEVSWRDVAYLDDRIAAADSRAQVYGTQGKCQGGAWSPFEISDPGRVDERRTAIGLEPMAEYAKKFKDMCG